MFGYFKRKRRERIAGRPFPRRWEEIIDRNVPHCRRLSREERAGLRGLVQIFLDEKRFEGCGGQEITDEVRVTIAAQACVLLLNRPTDIYPRLTSVLVYPSHYEVPPSAFGPSWTNEPGGRSGESWYRGPVVLSWDEALRGAADPRDGRNLILHEFAHQIDTDDGEMDGAPALGGAARYRTWARILGAEYDRLIQDAMRDRASLLDHYGASDEAEFFAVATEAFFERPRAMKRSHPEMYEQLRKFYRQDPAERE
mgnify:CR=1 FL=1